MASSPGPPTPPSGRRWRQIAGLVLLLLLLTFSWGGCQMLDMPGASFSGPLPALTAEEQSSAARLRSTVETLATTIGPRHVGRPEALEAAAAFIEKAFTDLGYRPATQSYTVGRQSVRNIEVEIPGTARPAEIFLLGAHYDSIPSSPAANDNGSGVAALLELARVLKDSRPARTLRFVAFVNEEPPYFQTDLMGSRVYAQRCRQQNENITGMFSLETMAYFSDAPHSQNYPVPFSLLYPSTGNFIAFVGNFSSRRLVHQAVGSFRRQALFPSEGGAIPDVVEGIGWSDQWSFWQEGYAALMVTDTAPFRYAYYHTPEDTPDKCDFEKLARVAAGLGRVVGELANQP